MVCDACSRAYRVKVDVDAKEFLDAEELDIEIRYCPFCGSNEENESGWLGDGFDGYYGTDLDL